ncbi:inorganic diphosphatase [Candidatus Microgenomates bacterium]|nr:inorganic diphosphatase [Candidatus Microgenomates bacterium]
MSLKDLTYGDKAPAVVNVVIEIQKGGRNKYEINKSTGLLTLDRVNATMLGYPADYGYIPKTLCGDGDPLDVLVVIDEPLLDGVVVPARPIGVLYMEDDGGADEKIIAVAAADISKDHIQNVDDLGPNFKKAIEHFYRHYKDWRNDWSGVHVKFNGWGDATEAKQVVQESIERVAHTD